MIIREKADGLLRCVLQLGVTLDIQRHKVRDPSLCHIYINIKRARDFLAVRAKEPHTHAATTREKKL